MARYNESQVQAPNVGSVAPVRTQETKQIDLLSKDIENLIGGSNAINKSVYEASEYATTLAALDTDYNTKKGYEEIYNQTVGAKLSKGEQPTSADYKNMIDWRTNYFRDVTQQVVSKDENQNNIYKEKFYKPSMDALDKANKSDMVMYQNLFLNEKTEEFNQEIADLKSGASIEFINKKAELLKTFGGKESDKKLWGTLAVSKINDFMTLDNDSLAKEIMGGNEDKLLARYFGEYLYYGDDKKLENYSGVEDNAAITMKNAFSSKIRAIKAALPDGENQSTAQYREWVDQINTSISQSELPSQKFVDKVKGYYYNFIAHSPNLSFSQKDTFKKQWLAMERKIYDVSAVNNLFVRDNKVYIPDDIEYQTWLGKGFEKADGTRIEKKVFADVLTQKIQTVESEVEKFTVDTSKDSAATFQKLLNDTMKLNKLALKKPDLFKKFDDEISGKSTISGGYNRMKQVTEYMRFQNKTNGLYKDNTAFLETTEQIINDEKMDDVSKARAIDKQFIGVRTNTDFQSDLGDIRKVVDKGFDDRQTRLFGVNTDANLDINKAVASMLKSKGFTVNRATKYVKSMVDVDVGSLFTNKTDKTLFFPSGTDARYVDRTIARTLKEYNSNSGFNVTSEELDFEPITDENGDIGYNMFYISDTGTKTSISNLTKDSTNKLGKASSGINEMIKFNFWGN